MRITTTLLALAVVACGGGSTEPDYPDITIRVSGTVTAAGDGSPILRAAVSVHKQEWFYDQYLIVRTWTDNLCQYSLSFVWEGPCHDGSFRIEAERSGYGTSDYHTFIRCTEETQTIDFELGMS
jgi:hypothetical protein